MVDLPVLDNDRTTIGDVVELIWIPTLLALSMAAATWTVWYYTHTVCTFEIASLTGCNPASIARYLDIDIFGRMLTYAVLVGGLGGFWRYDMIRKERAARIAAQNQLAELQKRWQEERQREHEAFMATMEELRLRSAEERQAFLTALSELTAELAHLRQQRNGGGHNGQ